MDKKYISVLVKNHEGVLARLSSLFCQRGFNIDSLNVSATNDSSLSRVTITTSGSEEEIEQIIKQTKKLEEYVGIFELEPKDSLIRELLIIKIAQDAGNRSSLLELATIYNAKIIDISVGSIVFELAGKPAKIDSFIENLKIYDIMEMCRTGVTAIQRGNVKLVK
ncbi:MAG: acetolactate synthase small subunit [Lachnospiraceae bacterium]|nr:acetolactate synthase small subunit [Lachnospiraceae bacterium]